jgi:hypothetical protein
VKKDEDGNVEIDRQTEVMHYSKVIYEYALSLYMQKREL